MAEDKPKKYLDINLEYTFEEQSKIDSMIKAINAFIETHKEGLTRTSYNVLGFSYNF